MKSCDLAKWIINYSNKKNKPKSLLKLFKLMYLLHRDFLGVYNQKLVDDEAFVICSEGYIFVRSVDRMLFEFGANPITQTFSVHCEIPQEDFLSERLDSYLLLKPYELVASMHQSIPYKAWISTNAREELEITHSMIIKDCAFNESSSVELCKTSLFSMISQYFTIKWR